jgi:hypothetical protein
MDQDPRTGSYPLADEANKWGSYVDQFLQAWKEARMLQDPRSKSEWCRPAFSVAIGEFWYVLGQDETFVRGDPKSGWLGYAYYEQRDPKLDGPVTPDEMNMILSRAKEVINRERHLWGYPRAQRDEPYRVVPRSGGNGSKT